MKKRWTVKEVCDLTGLTGKHLYYFHHEGVVKAAEYANYSVEGHDGYKLYDEAGVAKLQQIAMYYELGLKRNEIRDLMQAPGYDMHHALDELYAKLDEKRLRIERHLAAIDQLRLIGTRNGLLDVFSSLSLDKLGKNSLAFSQSSLDEWWFTDVDENDMDQFSDTFEYLLQDLSKLSYQELINESGKKIIGQIFRESIHYLGLPGYLLTITMFLSAAGEGTISNELAQELPVKITPEHGKAALSYFMGDINSLSEEIANVIAQHHEIIGAPFNSPDVMEMISSIKNLLKTHFGVHHDKEYKTFLDQIEIEPYNGTQGYMNYVINALKYHCGSK